MRINFFFYLALSVFLISCDDNDFETTRTVVLEPYYFVELHDVFEVYLVQDTTYNIKITGDQDVIRNVKFSIEEEVLKISNPHKRKWLNPDSRRVKLYVNSSFLYRIDLYETCYIKSLEPVTSDQFAIVNQPTPRLCEIDIELDNNYFLYWNNYQCGGKINLHGKTGQLEVHTFALMTLDASNLIANSAVVENGSKGDTKVNVIQQLEYSIHDTGNIYLYGSPNEIILKERTSSGKLILME